MHEPATPALRWLRAVVLASVAFGLGLAAHLSAGGLVPGPVGLGILFGVTVTASAAFLGRAASTLRVTALVMAGQAFVHAGLTAAAGHAGDPVRARAAPTRPAPLAPVDRHGSLYDAYQRGLRARGVTTDQLVVPDWAQHLVDDLTGPHAVMAVAHLVAAALVGLWLASGERALWALIRLSRATVGAVVHALASALTLLAPAGPARLCDARLDGVADHRPGTLRLASTHVRRGPPALLAA